MDEVTLTGATFVAEIDGDLVREYRVTPEDFALQRCALSELQGGDARSMPALFAPYSQAIRDRGATSFCSTRPLR
jgi:anthranilate phosphoribosyltransferase